MLEEHLTIRADAGTRMGTGHLMRCIALGQAWLQMQGPVTFVSICESESLRQRLCQESFSVDFLSSTATLSDAWQSAQAVLSAYPGSWIAFDGYHFEQSDYLRAGDLGHRVLAIEDFERLSYYPVDLLLNQNIGAELFAYASGASAHLLGTQYVLLRDEFLLWRDWHRQTPEIAKKILVTLGGGDPDNQTLKVLKAVLSIEESLEVIVVVGGSNPHLAQLAQEAADFPNVRILQNANNMPELMAWADMAISAGGSTCWELAFMGLPTVTIVIAENQIEIAEGLSRSGFSINLGWFEQVRLDHIKESVEDLLRNQMERGRRTAQAARLVDGEGRQRIVSCMRSLEIAKR